jgi:hypothetical protein
MGTRASNVRGSAQACQARSSCVPTPVFRARRKASFQQIVSQGISDSYLHWPGIEATLQLSQSTNAKVVIIGSFKDGLPVIARQRECPRPTRAGPISDPTMTRS